MAISSAERHILVASPIYLPGQGLGIASAPVWHFRDKIETGRLKVLRDGSKSDAEPIHAIYPSRRLSPLKTRVMITYLAQRSDMDPMLR